MAKDKRPGVPIGEQAPEEQKPEPPAPEVPGSPPAPEQGAQAVIPGMEGPPPPENKVIDLSSVRAGAGPEQQAAPAPEGGQEWKKPQEEKKPRRGRPPKDKEAPAQGDKPKRKGRPAKGEKQAPGGGGAGKPVKTPKQEQAPRQGKPAPAKEGPAPPPPAPEQPPQLKDASRGKKEEIVYLLGLWFQSMFVGITMWALTICIFLITFGRMIEIYLVTSVAPIPMAAMMGKEWGGMGQNYLRSLFALGFQAFLIMICVAIYAVLVQNIGTGGDVNRAIWTCMGYTVLLCFTLFKTGSLAKAIFAAH